MAKKETIDLEVIKGMHPDCFNTPENIANLGCDYCNGEGVNENCEIGRTLLEKAAEMGSMMIMMGMMMKLLLSGLLKLPLMVNWKLVLWLACSTIMDIMWRKMKL